MHMLMPEEVDRTYDLTKRIFEFVRASGESPSVQHSALSAASYLHTGLYPYDGEDASPEATQAV